MTWILGGLEGLDYGASCVERAPLHVCPVNGNICIDKMTMPPGFGDGGGNGGGGGDGGPTAVAPMGVCGATSTNQAVLQSILLAQKCCQQSLSLLQGQIDNGFSAFKVRQQQWFVTLNHNVRRFRGTIQGGLPSRTQCKLALEEGPLPSKRTVHQILQMTAPPSCAPTFTPYRTYGKSGGSASVDASLLLASTVKNIVDTVPRERNSDTAVGSECGTLWIG